MYSIYSSLIGWTIFWGAVSVGYFFFTMKMTSYEMIVSNLISLGAVCLLSMLFGYGGDETPGLIGCFFLCFGWAMWLIRVKSAPGYNGAYLNYVDERIMFENEPPTDEDLMKLKRKNFGTTGYVPSISHIADQNTYLEKWLADKRMKRRCPYECKKLAESGELRKYSNNYVPDEDQDDTDPGDQQD